MCVVFYVCVRCVCFVFSGPRDLLCPKPTHALSLIHVAPQGLITITDNDLIEKSNLNRQFLFRPEHIQVFIFIPSVSLATKLSSRFVALLPLLFTFLSLHFPPLPYTASFSSP